MMVVSAHSVAVRWFSHPVRMPDMARYALFITTITRSVQHVLAYSHLFVSHLVPSAGASRPWTLSPSAYV